MYATSPGFLWIVVLAGSAALLAMPFLWKEKGMAAVVDPANCNGCGRCVADCPYQAVVVSQDNKASVFAERCAACGICAGACPSSTPFRSIQELVSGIELPDLRIQGLREQVRDAKEVVFCCERNAVPGAIALRCLGQLPPAFVEYALRRGAKHVRAVGCEDCAYRLGMELCDERFARVREPRLRANVAFEREGNEYRFRLRST
jgi:ferredoxin